jgi:hypothetical protein
MRFLVHPYLPLLTGAIENGRPLPACHTWLTPVVGRRPLD